MIHVERWAAAAIVAALAGCAGLPQTAPATVKVAAAEEPCKADVPPRPAYPADILTGDEDLFTMGSTLWADRKARQARELVLETIVLICTKPPALPSK